MFRVVAFPDVKLKFGTSENSINLFDISQGNQKPDTFLAVDVVAPSTDEMQDYLGEYFSSELNIVYAVILTNDKLMLKRRKYGESELLPTFRDGFISDLTPGEGDEGGLDIQFTRDEKENVNGLKVSTGRVRNLMFVKR